MLRVLERKPFMERVSIIMVIYIIKHWFCRILVKTLTPTFACTYIDLKLGVGLSENRTFTQTFARQNILMKDLPTPTTCHQSLGFYSLLLNYAPEKSLATNPYLLMRTL